MPRRGRGLALSVLVVKADLRFGEWVKQRRPRLRSQHWCDFVAELKVLEKLARFNTWTPRSHPRVRLLPCNLALDANLSLYALCSPEKSLFVTY